VDSSAVATGQLNVLVDDQADTAVVGTQPLARVAAGVQADTLLLAPAVLMVGVIGVALASAGSAKEFYLPLAAVTALDELAVTGKVTVA